MFETAPDLPDYTEDEKFLFDTMIVEDAYLDMYVFQRTNNVTKYINLYHSFSKHKGKYQSIIDEQWRRGAEEYSERVQLMFNGMDITEDVSAMAFDYVKATVDQMREYELAGFGGKSPIIN